MHKQEKTHIKNDHTRPASAEYTYLHGLVYIYSSLQAGICHLFVHLQDTALLMCGDSSWVKRCLPFFLRMVQRHSSIAFSALAMFMTFPLGRSDLPKAMNTCMYSYNISTWGHGIVERFAYQPTRDLWFFRTLGPKTYKLRKTSKTWTGHAGSFQSASNPV